MDEINERKELVQEVVERLLGKYLYNQQFKAKLKELIEIFPLTTDINFEPSTFKTE